ncbi:hypothetical protein UFOVP98_3 [uncultured Caudovirales phage]|uniref:Uncharacterized protein n=1 Tax=uncultured Caudovirales phage TaxID=2100421 RepID=A0A6J5LIQ4_9CAUD|nr:hypothetical protein UFOVP98_3 [uncultured Caudovirales phage]CAB4134051.1 hypothetical protein UFOVP269_3 [uncultured Caudovirales phage]
MISWGFAFGFSDLAVLDTLFVKPSIYIYVSGDAGDIVYENTAGLAQYFPGAQANGLYPIAARRILTSGIVNGNSQTTTATDLVYCSTNIP